MKFMTSLAGFSLRACAGIALASATTLTFAQTFNYGEALQKSIYFYEAQQAGPKPATNRVPWRADSVPNDGADVGVDLRGGWFDAGDHVKFGFPMAGSASLLAWGVVDYRSAYVNSGQLTYALNNLRFVNDYFIKAHSAPNELYGQVGIGAQDHTFWGPAEVLHYKIPNSRVSAKISLTCPGVDLAAETAAAMAASSMAFKPTDTTYAATLLTHAKQLFSFAEATKGTNGVENSYSNCITDSTAFYNSNYGVYWDELAWGALWLWRATGDDAYLTKAKGYYDKMGTESQSTTPIYKWAQSWNDKAYGVYALFAGLVGDARYQTDIQRHLDYWSIGAGKRTPGGIIVVDASGWGVNRYAANTALLALYYADKLGTSNPLYARYHNFGKKQIDYILGDNPADRSFMVGFGKNYPINVHHRTSHGSWADDMKTPAQQRHILYGAVVGGPSADTDYVEDRGNYVLNEVATDYNAGFTSATAILFDHYGGAALPDSQFPPAESQKPDEYLVGAKVNSSGPRHIEIKAVIQNHSTTPAKGRQDLYIRYFYDLSEAFAAGYQVSDLTVSSGYSQASSISNLKQWFGNIYYVEISFAKDVIFPGGQSEHRREVQFRVSLPTTSTLPEWDNSNDPSYDPAFATTTENYGLTTNKIAIYGSEGLISGIEPPRTVTSSSASSSKSSVASSSIASSSSSFKSSSSTSSVILSSSSSSRSSISSVASSSSVSSVVSGQQCNWYGTLYPLCATTTSGWGYENGKSCIAASTCAAQPAPYGIVGTSSSIASSSASSKSVSSSSIASSVSSSSKSSSLPVSSSSSIVSSSSSSVKSSSSVASSVASSSSSSVAAGKCQYIVSNEWSTGFTATIRVTNNGATTINGWALGWSYSDGTQVTSSWNATLTGTNPYSATNLSWNSTIQPGQSAEFGVQGTKGSSASAQVPAVTGSACN